MRAIAASMVLLCPTIALIVPADDDVSTCNISSIVLSCVFGGVFVHAFHSRPVLSCVKGGSASGGGLSLWRRIVRFGSKMRSKLCAVKKWKVHVMCEFSMEVMDVQSNMQVSRCQFHAVNARLCRRICDVISLSAMHVLLVCTCGEQRVTPLWHKSPDHDGFDVKEMKKWASRLLPWIQRGLKALS